MTTPAYMQGISSAVAVTCGERHTCVLTEAAEVWCAGSNDAGETGDEAPGPVPRRLAQNVEAVSAGSRHTCVLRDGAYACVGPNWVGQLGTGDQLERRALEDLRLGQELSHLECAANACCATVSTGEAWCWGDNSWGWMSPSLTAGRTVTPGRFGIDTVTAIGLSGSHACATDPAGAVWCMGANRNGQLGNRRATNSSDPVRVLGPPDHEK